MAYMLLVLADVMWKRTKECSVESHQVDFMNVQ
jgi:hypothetical protein